MVHMASYGAYDVLVILA